MNSSAIGDELPGATVWKTAPKPGKEIQIGSQCMYLTSLECLQKMRICKSNTIVLEKKNPHVFGIVISKNYFTGAVKWSSPDALMIYCLMELL